jgi:ABC-2 type transport system permease protein
MSRLAGYAGGAVGVLQRDALIFTSYRLAFFTQLAATLSTIVLFYYISRLVTVRDFSSPDEYFAFAVIGIMSLEILNTAAIFVPGALRAELVVGTFERVVLSPFGAIAGTAASMLFPFIWTVAKTTLALGIATLVFDLPLQWPGAALAAPVAVLGLLSFAPVGLLVTALVLVTKRAQGVATWIVAGFSIVAGFYFPVTLLPGWLEWMSEVQPFTPTIELMRATLVGIEPSEPAWLSVLKLAGFAGALLPASLWVLKQAVRMSRRRGHIIEY